MFKKLMAAPRSGMTAVEYALLMALLVIVGITVWAVLTGNAGH